MDLTFPCPVQNSVPCSVKFQACIGNFLRGKHSHLRRDVWRRCSLQVGECPAKLADGSRVNMCQEWDNGAILLPERTRYLGNCDCVTVAGEL